VLAAVLRRRWLVVLVVAVVLVGAGVWFGLRPGGTAEVACPPPAPETSAVAAPPAAGPISLTGWKLSLPVTGPSGNAATVQPAAVSAPWLTDNPGGGLMFWAPAVGATTKHSEHPRTELDSLTDFAAGSGRHTLTASLTVLQEPRDTQGVIVGQIHGSGTISSVPYVMVRHQLDRLYVVVKQVKDGNDHVNYPLLNGLPLNTPFTFSVTDSGDGCLAFTATTPDGRSRSAAAPVPGPFLGQPVRFQAGDYQQSKEPIGADDGARVVFDSLREGPGPP
jgi:hypothetical protein